MATEPVCWMAERLWAIPSSLHPDLPLDHPGRRCATTYSYREREI